MIPPDLGVYTVEERPMCLSNGELAPRRMDVGRPRWGKGGMPAQTETSAQDNFAGVASRESRPLEVLQTEQGPVALPYGPGGDITYMPSSRTLGSLYSTDTRRTAISDRYYR